MTPAVVVDTGPLVAMLNKSEASHLRTVAALEGLPSPLLTTEPVLTEAAFLLRRITNGSNQLMSLVEEGFVRVPFALEPEATRLRKLMRKYANVPMSLADASLVLLSESLDGSRLFTFDADFDVYRTTHGHIIARVES